MNRDEALAVKPSDTLSTQMWKLIIRKLTNIEDQDIIFSQEERQLLVGRILLLLNKT